MSEEDHITSERHTHTNTHTSPGFSTFTQNKSLVGTGHCVQMEDERHLNTTVFVSNIKRLFN